MRHIVRRAAVTCGLLLTQSTSMLPAHAASYPTVTYTCATGCSKQNDSNGPSRPYPSVTYTCAAGALSVTPPAGWGDGTRYSPSTQSEEQSDCTDNNPSMNFTSVDSRASVEIDISEMQDVNGGRHEANDRDAIDAIEELQSGGWGINPAPKTSYRLSINGIRWVVASTVGTYKDVHPAKGYFLFAKAAANGILYEYFGAVNTANRSYKAQVNEVMNTLKSIHIGKLTTKPTATPIPQPTAIPAPPAPAAILSLSGGGNKQSETFKVSGDFHVVWSANLQSGQTVGTFSIELKSTDGSVDDLLANYSGGSKHDSTVVHDDCSGGCYLEMDSLFLDWNVTVTQ